MVVEVSGGRAVQEPLVALAALLASVVSALLPGLATGALAAHELLSAEWLAACRQA